MAERNRGVNMKPVMVMLRAFAVWLILVFVETIHGVFRRLVLEPLIGDFPARQVGDGLRTKIHVPVLQEYFQGSDRFD